jgi:hypothetical protein
MIVSVCYCFDFVAEENCLKIKQTWGICRPKKLYLSVERVTKRFPFQIIWLELLHFKVMIFARKLKLQLQAPVAVQCMCQLKTTPLTKFAFYLLSEACLQNRLLQ